MQGRHDARAVLRWVSEDVRAVGAEAALTGAIRAEEGDADPKTVQGW